MNDINHNYLQIKYQIDKACLKANRPIGSVRLLVVSKMQPIPFIQQLYEQGQANFGESRVQEALVKIQQVNNLNITWHFIGPIQSNKAKDIATKFSWVHSVSSLTIADLLNAHRPITTPPLNVCIQLNINNEPQKSGISLAELPKLIDHIMLLPNLRLRGFMCIPSINNDLRTQEQTYELMRQTFNSFSTNLKLDTLSVGMSNDFELAIQYGATYVRIGSAIFKNRYDKV